MENRFKINENAKMPKRELSDDDNIYQDLQHEYASTTSSAFLLAVVDYFNRQGIKARTLESDELVSKLWSRFRKMYNVSNEDVNEMKKKIQESKTQESEKKKKNNFRTGMDYSNPNDKDDDDET